MNHIKLLRPIKIGDAKRIRVGGFGDGGYIVLDKIMNDATILYNFGVGNEVSFELDFIKREGRKVHMFDHTVNFETPEKFKPMMNFHKLALDVRTSKNGNTLRGHMQKLGDNFIGRTLLTKMDVEGFELDYFSTPLEDHIKHTSIGLIVEFHVYSKRDVEKFKVAMKNICEHFTTYHIHANNYVQKYFDLDGHKVPQVFEVSFANNYYFNIQEHCGGPYLDNYPVSGLDFPCAPEQPGYEDHNLTELMFT